MNESTLNSFTTFIPVMALSCGAMLFAFIPYANAKSIALFLALSALPTQGLVIILRKRVFIKHWLSKKEKLVDGILWIIGGLLIGFKLYKDRGFFL